MPSINLTVIGGNLSRDPELRVTPKGTAVCSFSVANNREYKDEQGQKVSEVTFLECVAWGKTGETIAKYFAKGDPIIVRGRLKMEQWEDKQTGAKRSAIKLQIMFPEGGFDFAGPTKGQSSNAGSQRGDQQQQPQCNRPQQPRPQPEPSLEDDVPF